MRTVSRSVGLWLSLGLLLTLLGCSRPEGGTFPLDDGPVTIPPPGGPDEYLLAVGQLEPKFGGFFLDGAQLSVYLLNVDTATQAEKDRVVRTLLRVYGDGELGAYPPRFLNGRLRPG